MSPTCRNRSDQRSIDDQPTAGRWRAAERVLRFRPAAFRSAFGLGSAAASGQAGRAAREIRATRTGAAAGSGLLGIRLGTGSTARVQESVRIRVEPAAHPADSGCCLAPVYTEQPPRVLWLGTAADLEPGSGFLLT